MLVLIPVFGATLQAGEVRYQWVRVWINSDAQLPQVVSLGLEVEGARLKHNTFIEGVAIESAVEQLTQAGFKAEILQPDLASIYEQRLRHDRSTREFDNGSMGGYFTYDEITSFLDSLHGRHPDIVSAKISIGQSVEGRDIWAIKISDNVETHEDEPEVFYNSLTHAREPAAMMAILYFANQLADEYSTNPEFQYLVNTREIWFVPVVNPDGYTYNETTHPNGGGMHRKNMEPGCTTLLGVDLNRNYGYNWGYDDVGSSSDNCSDTYRGSAPFSEPESQAIRDFTESHNFITVFNYHSYSDELIMPFGYAVDAVPPEPDYTTYLELGHDLVADNGYLFGTGIQTVGYLTNGDAVDWMYGSAGIINFTPEVGSYADGGFWPPAENIMPIVLENVLANIHLALVAGNCVVLDTLAVAGADEFLQPDASYNFQISLRNKGFIANPASIETFTISSPDNSISISPNTFELNAIPALNTVDLISDTSQFHVNAVYGQPATLISQLHVTGNYSRRDTLRWMVGIPDTLFADGAENGLANWVNNGWGVTSDAYIGSYAFTESPNGNYPNNIVRTMTLLDSIDLTAYNYPRLTFRAKWNIENEYDFAQVLGSGDGGVTWAPLAGEFTQPGSGNGVQLLEQPGYDGTQSTWVHENIDLSEFIESNNFKFALRLASDNYVNADGIDVDDIAVLGWSALRTAGDVNNDGTVNILDLVLLVDGILQIDSLTPLQIQASDLNHDGLLNVLDLVLLVNTILQA